MGGDCNWTVERGPHGSEIGSSVPGWVKPMSYEIDTCRFLVRHLAFLGECKDWLAQCLHNVTECDIRSRCWWLDSPVWWHYKITTFLCCFMT